MLVQAMIATGFGIGLGLLVRYLHQAVYLDVEELIKMVTYRPKR